MKFNNVCIEALGYHLPEQVVSSDDIEKRLSPIYDALKLPYGRLQLMSGIRERRFFDKSETPSSVASIAGEQALSRTTLDRKRIGCLIHASVCRDFLEPATAAVVHNNLKLDPGAMVFDISNACLGVLNGMVTVANMIELGQIEAGLIVSGENGGPLVDATIENLLSRKDICRADVKSAFASLTIASAAVAVLLTHRDISTTGHRLLGGAAMAETRFNDLCRGEGDSGVGPLMETDSEAMLKEGCQLAGRTWEQTRSELGWSNDDVDRVFCHQVGSAHRRLLYETLQLDPAKDFSTLEFLGNTGSASLPSTLAIGEERGLLEKGNRAALLGIGSGLNCLMLGVEW
ncbi:MAG: 3-oxoacyl-ACP synthase III [Candidatus Nitrohelix vancouverensis]|uniref:3-oxoacyl-ACP synthase III n=1 Tax=Candidatus Nitrohelix vancouverensis TaxID=2705534 RepID=A0A7T0C3X0_9BACT|nr:MAG: 3-oxoacyl-ACP synthase III [Candidatus Nitrohelix vancouverensis]